MTRIILYALGLYTFVFCSGYIINSHGLETDQRSCSEYLRICETSCALRGELYRFGCLGRGIDTHRERYRCICADDAFGFKPRQAPVQEHATPPASEVTK
jgi:hypothetical protein